MSPDKKARWVGGPIASSKSVDISSISGSSKIERLERTNPILDRVLQQRRDIAALKLDEQQALQMLPGFITQIGSLIANKVPVPEVIVKKYRSILDGDWEESRKLYSNYMNDNGPDYNTRLTATIPVKDGDPIKVTITSTGYPDTEINDSAQELAYRIDVTELGSILVFDSQSGIIQSEKWESEPFTMDTVIGSPLKRWPLWERNLRVQDIQEYQVLLDRLNQEDVVFEGKTPPKIKKEYSNS